MPLAENKQRSSYRGYLYIASATFLWGVSANLGRAVFTGRLLRGHIVKAIDPAILSQTRITFSFLVLLPILFAWRGRKGLRIPLVDFGRMALVAVLGVVGSTTFIIWQYNEQTWRPQSFCNIPLQFGCCCTRLQEVCKSQIYSGLPQ